MRELKARAGEGDEARGPTGSLWELGVFYIRAAWDGDGASTSARWRGQQQVGAPGSCLVREQALENSVWQPGDESKLPFRSVL